MRLRCTRCGHYHHLENLDSPDEYPAVCCKCLVELTWDDGIAVDPVRSDATRIGRVDFLIHQAQIESHFRGWNSIYPLTKLIITSEAVSDGRGTARPDLRRS
jgi:hypothetical protein